ncbi:MAG: hypothetical protein WB816_18255 [Methylocystis sp.]
MFYRTVQENQLRILRRRIEHDIVDWRADGNEAVRPIMLDRRLFQALIEIGGEDGRDPTLVENLGQGDVSAGRRNVERVDELLEEFPAIAFHPEQIVDRVGIKVGG